MKLADYGHTMRKQGRWVEKEIIQVHAGEEDHQYVDRTPRGRVNQNDRVQRKMEKVRPWCGQPWDRGSLKNRPEQYGVRRILNVTH